MTIKNDITTETDTKIDGMTIAGGFNFDYDNINEFRPGSKTYPSTKTEYFEDEYEDPDEQVVNSYTSKLTSIFIVTVDNVTEPNARLACAKVLEDFQRLMEKEHPNLQIKGMIKADLIKSEVFFTNVVKRPCRIEMEWEIMYRVQRTSPNLTT